MTSLLVRFMVIVCAAVALGAPVPEAVAEDCADIWEDLAEAVKDQMIPYDRLTLADCPEEFDEAAPHRRVMQWIRGRSFKWREYDLRPPHGRPRMFIKLDEPEGRGLSALEARILLSASRMWMSHARQHADPVYEDGTRSKRQISEPHESRGVFESDDRERVVWPSIVSYPWNNTGYLEMHKSSSWARGTAFLVSEHVGLTNAHALYPVGGYYDYVYFAPGQTQDEEGGTVVQPYGSVKVTKISDSTEPGYFEVSETYKDIVGQDPDDPERFAYDYGAIFFPDSFKTRPGYAHIETYVPLVFNFGSWWPLTDDVSTVGYPAEVHDEEDSKAMWHSSSVGWVPETDPKFYRHTCDTSGGNSGGPVWADVPGLGLRVVALHAGQLGLFSNVGPRLRSENQQLIEDWRDWKPRTIILDAIPPSQEVPPGSAAEYTIELERIDSDAAVFFDDWTIELPPGVESISYWPNPVSGDVTTLTVNTGADLPAEYQQVPVQCEPDDVLEQGIVFDGINSVAIGAIGSSDTTPPHDVLITYPASDGTEITSPITIAASADDDVELDRVEFWVDGVFLSEDDESPYASDIWDPDAYSGDVTLEARAYDTSENETIAYRYVYVPGGSGALNVAFKAKPESIPVDGQASATLTATVTDAAGDPVSGVDVTISKTASTHGHWVDVYGAVISEPDNEPTDDDGRSRAYFRPSEVQTCQFTASIEGDSATTFFFAVPPSELEITLTSEQMALGDGYADYWIEAVFMAGDEPIDHGTAEFTTTVGEWTSGSGQGTQTTTTEIGTFGEASATLRVFSSELGTICATYVEGGDTYCENFWFTIDEPPLIESAFALAAPGGGTHPILDVGTNYLAALVYQKGLALWDTRTWELVKYWTASSDEEWTRSEIIGVSINDEVVIVAGWEDVGFFYIDTLEHHIVPEPPHWPEEDLDIAPDASRWIGIEDDGGDNGGDTFLYYGMDGYPDGDLDYADDLPDETEGVGIAYSPAGDRAAVTYRDGANNDAYLMITYGPSSFPLLKKTMIDSGSRPGGVAWSNDGQYVAASNGEGLIKIFDKNANHVLSIPLPEGGGGEAGSISWSPDDQYIAAHVTSFKLSIFTPTGQEVARCDIGGGDERDTDTIAWRYDNKVVFATNCGSGSVKVFAPFDGEAPDLDVSDPQPYEITEDTVISVEGSVEDDTGLIPGSVIWRLDDDEWAEVELNPYGYFDFDIEVSLGIHTIEIQATDLAGKVSHESVPFEVVAPVEIEVRIGETVLIDGQSQPIDFGETLEGGPGVTRTFAVTNVGGGWLDVGPVGLPEGFSITEPLVGPLAESQSDNFTVRLDPSDPGEKSGIVTIENSDEDENPFEFPITGTVIEGTPSCPADCAQPPDGMVDVLDLLALLGAWGPCAGCPEDITGDGVVDVLDLLELLAAWGPCP